MSSQGKKQKHQKTKDIIVFIDKTRQKETKQEGRKRKGMEEKGWKPERTGPDPNGNRTEPAFKLRP